MNGKALTFYLHNHLFGIDITLVKEINRNVEFTPVPGAPPHVVGLLNMRGQVVTLFSLSKMMGYQYDEARERTACVILKPKPHDQGYIGFIIDKPGDVIDVTDDISEHPPANIGNIEGKFLKEVVKLKKQLLLMIEPEQLFEP